MYLQADKIVFIAIAVELVDPAACYFLNCYCTDLVADVHCGVDIAPDGV
ncbi:hypothetical protein [Nostoc sp.]